MQGTPSGPLLQALQEYNKDNIPPKAIEKIRKEFIPDPKFTPQLIAKASSAAEGLCKWVLAMVMSKSTHPVTATFHTEIQPQHSPPPPPPPLPSPPSTPGHTHPSDFSFSI